MDIFLQRYLFLFVVNISKLKNIPLLHQVVAEGVKFLPAYVKVVMMNFLNVVYKEELIFTRTAREVLFGYDDPALSQLMSVLPSYFDRKNIGYFIRVCSNCF